MFWRFGFHNTSSIDTLLDREDVALEDILDEDDLLQECKSQNTRLIDYFQRLDVLQRLLGYVTGSIEGEEKGQFKFPYVAAEVLCSDIWSIVEVCVTNSDQILAPFWESILDRSPEEMHIRSVSAAHFAKINGIFMNKKPTEMLAFIKTQSFVVERLILHIETPAMVDLLFRIIQLDEYPSGAGVLEWLTSQKLVPRLVDLLSPNHSPEVHLVAADVIKGIIAMSAPSPGASALNDGLQHVPACNCFARELAARNNITKLLRFMLDDFPVGCGASPTPNGHAPSSGKDREEFIADGMTNLPDATSATSSVVNSISIIIELIRKNNSDYFEPYLFHNVRNRLIQVQQQLHMQSEDSRDVLEGAMKELVDRMGVVHLGALLESFCERLDGFQKLLKNPRSLAGPLSTTVGIITPLTIERFRICELYAELLHCSNMALLNRLPGTGPIYDDNGRLMGGLSALEELARVISTGNGENQTSEEASGDAQEMVEAKELPVHSVSSLSTRSTDSSSLASDSDSELSDHSSDDVLEEIAVLDPPDRPSTREQPGSVPDSALLPTPNLSTGYTTECPPNTLSGERSVRSNSVLHDKEDTPSAMPVGDNLKQSFMGLNVVGTLLDFFFQFPWNNFLHGTVYDLVHQILTGRVEGSLNRELIITLFRDGRLLHRIVDGHEENDARSREHKGVRLGYMGHLTLISEDVISALGHYPEELSSLLRQYAPQPAWDHYVNGEYRETKRRDSSLLGGGKPVIAPGSSFQKGRWARVDEADSGGPINGINKPEATNAVGASAMSGEFRRLESSSPSFARYLAEEIHATPASQYTNSGSFSDTSDDDDDEEEEGWLAQSLPFEFSEPSTIRPQASSISTDPFIPSGSTEASTSSTSNNIGFGDSFTVEGDDDDGFGPFSDAVVSNDPFQMDQDDSPFDFGDFQVAEAPGDGEMTPTAGSWTFEGEGADGAERGF
ncbi:SIT4 phosphatase-associated protein-domain-containing protein [Hysterangium stoloniferum]|nr:SIT4 phosphatase-associated protein-domain-containing protein [Hysterangium stoloniferum]